MDYNFCAQRWFSAVHLGSCKWSYYEISHKHNCKQTSFLSGNKLETYSISLWGRMVYYCSLPAMFINVAATADDWKEQPSLTSWSVKDNFSSWTHWANRSSEMLLLLCSLHWGNLVILCQMTLNMRKALLDKIMCVFISITVLNTTSTSIIIGINQSFVYWSQRPSQMKFIHLWRLFVCFLYCNTVFQGAKSNCWLQVHLPEKWTVWI